MARRMPPPRGKGESPPAPVVNGAPPLVTGMTRNELVDRLYMMRVLWMESLIDPRRDLDCECGYPPVILPKQYRFMYDREGVATRVVSIYPDECWAVDPHVYETEDPEETEFEAGWRGLVESERCNPLHYLHRADVLSGIGRYGILLLGMDDGMDLSEPLPHIDPFGFPTVDSDGVPMSKKMPLRLLYMRPFDELMCHIINFERDPSNPRFGQPVYYHVLFADIRVGEPGMTAAAISVTSRVVHWSRVIHLADNRESSEVFGVPRMQPVFNRICDVRKILGGSAEMFWKGGFPGYSFELDPELTTAGVTLDQASLDKQFEDYSNGLKRYLSVVGLHAKSLAPQVADPSGNLTAQLNSIALSIGTPLRIFAGSEQAQLASGQDVRTWNRRLSRRHSRYLTPYAIRPLVSRLQAFGTLPPTRDGQAFKVWWPDINMPGADETSKIGDRIAAALMKYVMGGGYQVVAPRQFLTMILGLTDDQAEAVERGLLRFKASGMKIEPPNRKPGRDNQGGSPAGDS